MLQTHKPAANTQTLTVRLPARHAGQRNLWRATKDARVAIIPCGRGFGKSEEAVRELGDAALAGKRCHYGAPDYKRVEEVYDRLFRALQPVSPRHAYARRIELVTGGSIEFWTLKDKTAGQSRHPDFWYVDEAGLVPYLKTIVTESILPSLVSRRGRLVITGTPKGQNDYWLLMQMFSNDADAAFFSASSYDNPMLDAAEIDKLGDRLSEDQFAQEILAQFLEDGAGVFKYIRRAIYGPMAALADLPKDRPYQFSVDLASTGDYSVTTIWDALDKRPVYIDRRQGDYIPQMEWLAATCKLLRPSTVTMEINGNRAVLELARKLGIPVVPFVTTNDSKQQIINNLQIAFEHNTLPIPDYPPLVTELMAFESERLPGGRVRYSAPDGLHDDCVMSLAIGWSGLSRPKWNYGAGPI